MSIIFIPPQCAMVGIGPIGMLVCCLILHSSCTHFHCNPWPLVSHVCGPLGVWSSAEQTHLHTLSWVEIGS